MNIDYRVRHRHDGALFEISPEELRRRLEYLDQNTEGRVVARRRTDTRPGVEAPETIHVLSGLGGSGEWLVAVERHDEARIQGHASLMSEPAAMSGPRTAEALIAFAEKAKNGGHYDAANAAFALTVHEHFRGLECSLSVRERPKTPTGTMTDGYYDLAYVRSEVEETCIPVPKLRGEVAYWFAAHADRRAPMDHNRDTTGAGPTLDDLEALRSQGAVRAAVHHVLADDVLNDRYPR
jgi:hypothetical protein